VDCLLEVVFGLRHYPAKDSHFLGQVICHGVRPWVVSRQANIIKLRKLVYHFQITVVYKQI
jgi:hypothetical protein